MNFMKKAWEHLDKPLWLASILIGIVLTLVVDKLPFVTRVAMVEIVLILINGIFSIWSGYWIYKHQRIWGDLLIFRILYLITAYFCMFCYSPYFSLFYFDFYFLCFSHIII